MGNKPMKACCDDDLCMRTAGKTLEDLESTDGRLMDTETETEQTQSQPKRMSAHTFECVLDDAETLQSTDSPTAPPSQGFPSLRSLIRGKHAVDDDDSEKQEAFEVALDNSDEYYYDEGSLEDKQSIRRKRRVYGLCLAVLAVVIVVVALATRTGGFGNKNEGRSSSTAALQNEVVTDTPSDDDSTPVTDPAPDTIPPTAAPTCMSEIWPMESCYDVNSNITIAFFNCDALDDDWVGLYENDPTRDLNDLGPPDFWLWACGDNDCRGSVVQGEVEFHHNPPPNLYDVHLVKRNSGGPYASRAQSPTTLQVGGC